MRILISAYACEPDKGSEPGIGWNWVKQAAQVHQVWVITRANNRPAIEAALSNTPLPNAQWLYYDLPRWTRIWKRRQRGVHAYYYFWQIGAYFLAKRTHQRVLFQLVHHVTFGIYWMPTFAALLGVPFLWGPVGGAESAPRAFRRSFGLRGRLYEATRDFARALGEWDPFVRLSASRALLTLANTHETVERIRTLGANNIRLFPATGMASVEINTLKSLPARQIQPFRVLSLGRLLHWKGLELGLRAFAQFHILFPASEYWIIGEGPERQRLGSLARDLQVEGSVIFWGVLTRDGALKKLAECNVLMHASLHDSYPTVCLEAMAAGRPIICLDIGGPSIQVSDNSGIRVRADNPTQVVADLANALERLAVDPLLCSRLGQAAIQRVEESFCYDSGSISQLYQHLKTPTDLLGVPDTAYRAR